MSHFDNIIQGDRCALLWRDMKGFLFIAKANQEFQ
jgi:hypothetical protein